MTLWFKYRIIFPGRLFYGAQSMDVSWLESIISQGVRFYGFKFGAAPRLINYSTTAMTANVNLPANSVGFRE